MSIRGAEDAGGSGSGGSGNEAGNHERRASGGQRVAFEALVAVGDGPGGGFEAESVDVSPDGMRLRTAYLPAEGEKVVCRFDGMGTEMVVEGEVLWRREEAKGGEFGVRFVGLDEITAAAVRAMCMTLGDPGDEDPAAEAAGVARGSRVRLHIEGLGSPMKARVRTSGARELSVGSNLEFLKVGRALELEDVEQGEKREAIIDDVKVDVDPATNVPQLVVTLRFDKPTTDKGAEKGAAKKAEKSSAGPATRRAAETKPDKKADKKVAPADADNADAKPAQNPAAAMLARAVGAGQVAASKVGPVLAGAGLRAKGAMSGMIGLVQKRRTEQAEAKKATAPRRMTAPPPAGALTSDGRRLVRDDGSSDEEETALAPRSPRRAAAIGGALGLLAVLVIFGAVRFMGRSHATAATTGAQSASTAVAALPPAAEPAAAAPGTPTANVPLFGATPLSTTEPAAGATPAPSASAVASADPGAGPSDDDEPGDGAAGGHGMKEWGQGSVSHPIVLKIKMDGAIEKITGASGAMGFTISVPGRRSLSPSSADLARKDKRLASVNVVNTSHGAEVSVQFKDGVPPYLAKVKGDRLEIAIGKEGKLAKSKKKKKSKH